MKIVVNVDSVLLLLIMISCLFNGIPVQIVFWSLVSISLYRSRDDLMSTRYRKTYILIIVLFLLLLIIQFIWGENSKEVNIRLIGLTRCIIGISLFRLSSARIVKCNPFSIIIPFIIILNLVYFIDAIVNKDLETALGSINLVSCLNLMILPYVLSRKSCPISGLVRVMFVISFAGIAIVYRSGTVIIGFIVYIACLLVSGISKYIRQKEISNRFKIYLFSLAAFLVVLLFALNNNVRNEYIQLLNLVDIDRADILKGAVSSISNNTFFETLFGKGNSIFLHRVRYLDAHNAILECFMIYGIFGVVLFAIETITFCKDMISQTNPQNRIVIISSLVVGYMCYFLHPFFTTSILSKVIFVVANVSAMLSFTSIEE